ncbi:MAG: tetratricopeptide repeat protein [Anaerolineae bacterium]|nr:tetratricopeptide repeat protein [Anaerolineae bacterium]
MKDFLPPLDWTNLLVIPSLLLAYTVHELGHALIAYFLGDYSQVERGKITLNPLKHISWFGSLAFVIFGIGWPKPLQANPYNFKRRYLDMFLVALSGPIASLTMCLVGILLTLGIAAALVYFSGATTDIALAYVLPIPSNLPKTLNVQAWSLAFTGHITLTSFWLTFISLLPLPGLDGFAAVVSLVAFFRQAPAKADGPAKVGQRPPYRQPSQPQLESTLVDVSPILISQQKRRNNAADIHFKVGTEYHQQKKYDDAIARYRQAISNDQNFGPAYINMGLAYLAKGERQRAIQAFRGAIQYADDKRSPSEAWYQLHQLSEITPVDEEIAQKDMAQMGHIPWTDTRPRPNWPGLRIAAALLLVGGIFGYSYLLIQLVEFVRV